MRRTEEKDQTVPTMGAAEKASAGGAFQVLATDMLNKNQSASVDELESLR